MFYTPLIILWGFLIIFFSYWAAAITSNQNIKIRKTYKKYFLK